MNRKRHFSLLLIVLGVACFIVFKLTYNTQVKSDYIPIQPIAKHNNGNFFSGAVVCAECHSDIYDSHLKTTHYNSSGIADVERVKGSFKTHENSFELNDSITFRMNVRNNALYQDIVLTSKDSLIDSLRFNVFIGSGTKGQTYLNWQDSALYQLQVSYSALNKSWINSPGYPSNKLAPTRPIFERCLECHVTNAESTKNFSKRNIYEKSKMIYGVDCERCHGPSYDHVTFHKENPEERVAMNIQVFANLNRQQRLDACALCHSGIRGGSNNNAFAFVIGDTLKRFSTPDYDEKSIKDLDVHGNQYGLLTASKCFKNSRIMDCTTCHDPHKNERNDRTLFNNRCLQCHDTGKEASVICAVPQKNMNSTNSNCIQCHMPLIPSKTMRIETSTDTVKPVEVRTHLIGIYADSLLGYN